MHALPVPVSQLIIPRVPEYIIIPTLRHVFGEIFLKIESDEHGIVSH